MTRCFRYLASAYLFPAVGLTVLLTALAVLGSQLLQLSFFDSYFHGLPVMAALFLFFYSINLATYMMDIHLSMGGRRRDLFPAVLLIWLTAALLCLGSTILAALLPEWLGWENQPQTGVPFYRGPAAWPVLLLLYLLVQSAGTCAGRLFRRRKALGLLFFCLCFALIMALFVAALIQGLLQSSLWGDFVPVVCLISLAATLLFTLLLGRSIRRATVR